VTARPRVPEQVVVKACNEHAAVATGPRDKTVESREGRRRRRVASARRSGRGGAIADGGKGLKKARPSAVLVGAGAGSLYGVNDNR